MNIQRENHNSPHRIGCEKSVPDNIGPWQANRRGAVAPELSSSLPLWNSFVRSQALSGNYPNRDGELRACAHCCRPRSLQFFRSSFSALVVIKKKEKERKSTRRESLVGSKRDWKSDSGGT